MPKHQTTLPSESIGLDPNKIDERKMEERVYQYVAKEHSKRALSGDTLKQAGVPKGTVAPERKLRKEILQLSLFPDIYTKVKKVQHPGNVDFGEAHIQPATD